MPRWPANYKRRGVTPLVPMRIDKEVRDHFKMQGAELGRDLSTHIKHRLRDLREIDLLLERLRPEHRNLLGLIQGMVQEYFRTTER